MPVRRPRRRSTLERPRQGPTGAATAAGRRSESRDYLLLPAGFFFSLGMLCLVMLLRPSNDLPPGTREVTGSTAAVSAPFRCPICGEETPQGWIDRFEQKMGARRCPQCGAFLP